MATEPQRRENLLIEATAFEQRLLLKLPIPPKWLEPPPTNAIASLWCSEFCAVESWELFYGQHKQGGWSVYFDQQPVLQFNSQHQLRRLYASGQRYAAANGHLQQLRRDRLGGRVQFQQEQLPSLDEQLIVASCRFFLATATQLIVQGDYSLLGQHPAEDQDLVSGALSRMASLVDDFKIAHSARHI